MIVRSVTLENVGLFRRAYTLSLDAERVNECSAIVGLNGSGKSTVFRSVGLCLFGASDKSSFPSRVEYEARVHSLVRPLNGAGEVACGRVVVHLDVEREGGFHALEVSRAWRFDAEKLAEELRVAIDGEPVPLSGRELELWLANWAPPQRAGIILFDAEAAYAATEQQVGELVALAFRQAFGLDLINTLAADLAGLVRTMARRDKGAQESKKVLAGLDREGDRLARSLEALVEVERGLKRERGSLLSRAVEIRFMVGASSTGESEYVRVTRRLGQIDASRAALRSELDALCGGLAPATLCKGLARALSERISKEEQESIAFDSARGQRAAALAALDQLGRDDEWPGVQATRRQRGDFLGYLETVLLNGIGEPVEPAAIHDVTRADRTELRGWLSELESGAVERAAEVLHSRLIESDLERSDLMGRLSRVLDPQESDVLTAELARIEGRLSELDTELLRVAEERGAIGHQIVQNAKQSEEELRSAVSNLGASNKAEMLLRSRDAAVELSARIARMRAAEVGERAQRYLAEWLRKDDLVNSVEIDGGSLEIVLRNRGGDSINLGQLSAGERQVVILAILLSLRDVGQVQQPLLVDTPLARLDAVHAHRVARALAGASGQCLLFMTDEEWEMLQRVGPDLGVAPSRLPEKPEKKTRRVS